MIRPAALCNRRNASPSVSLPLQLFQKPQHLHGGKSVSLKIISLCHNFSPLPDMYIQFPAVFLFYLRLTFSGSRPGGQTLSFTDGLVLKKQKPEHHPVGIRSRFPPGQLSAIPFP